MTKCIGAEVSNQNEVSMTRINYPRSRVSWKLSRTVLKTSTSGDRSAEFNFRNTLNHRKETA
jgi:hypothetical protein